MILRFGVERFIKSKFKVPRIYGLYKDIVCQHIKKCTTSDSSKACFSGERMSEENKLRQYCINEARKSKNKVSIEYLNLNICLPRFRSI